MVPPPSPLAACLALLLLTPPCSAMFADDAGRSDFTVSTSGSSGTSKSWLSSNGESLITASAASSGVYDEDAAVGDGGGENMGGYLLGAYLERPSSSADTSSSSSCHLASRSASTGELHWRRNVCSAGSGSFASAPAGGSSTTSSIATLDSAGVLRGWSESEGSLLYNVDIAGSNSVTEPKVFNAGSAVGAVVQSSEDGSDVLSLHSAATGDALGEPIAAKQLLSEARIKLNGGSTAKILEVTSSGESVVVLAAKVDGDGLISVSSLAWTTVTIKTDGTKMTTAKAIKVDGNVKSSMLWSTVQLISAEGDALQLSGITPEGSSVITASIQFDASAGTVVSVSASETHVSTLHPLWTSIHSVHYQPSGAYIAISGKDNRYPITRLTTALYTYESKEAKIGSQVYTGNREIDELRQDEETQYDATIVCAGRQIIFERTDNAGAVQIKAFGVEGEALKAKLAVNGVSALPTEESITSVEVLACASDKVDALLHTEGWMTAYVSVQLGPSSVEADLVWSAEEALGSAEDAIFLDETHAVEVAAMDGSESEEEEALLQSLTLSSRLQMQKEQLIRFVTGGFVSDVVSIFQSASGLDLMGDQESGRSKERTFGFSKVAVLRTPVAIFGMDVSTTASGRGKILWKRTLSPRAAWSKLIHGGATSKTLSGGGQDRHATHSHEILVLEYLTAVGEGSAKIGWQCLDGLTGKVHDEGDVIVGSSPVAQIVPIYGHEVESSCRHHAAILHADESVTIVPDTAQGKAAALASLTEESGKNGLFGHSINRDTGKLNTYRLAASGEDAVAARLVGGSTFLPEQEKIVTVAYPRRNEVVQSPAVILGDDSLLLSYLNPHLAVIVTVATDEYLATMEKADDGIAKALGGKSDDQKAKPLGATKPGEEAPAAPAASATPLPSMFVNLVDTVSGRILHRTSHTEAAPSGIPVLISENWVIYAFSNVKSRRTEIGVLSLHEGMIEPKGITAFSAPEQGLAFSSFTSPKPIVLAKTYTMASPVTAIGVTVTKEGISSKQILMATGEAGQVISVDRRMLDPRRPKGEATKSEKKEGLHQYHPLIPVVTLRIPSYSQRIEAVASIISTAANVESQSLVLAHGGPDLFFARLSPSRGFDLLPDTFNRALLSIVVIGLCVLVATVKKMSTRKMLSITWS